MPAPQRGVRMDCKEQMSQCFLTAGAVRGKTNISRTSAFCLGTIRDLSAGIETTRPTQSCVKAGQQANSIIFMEHAILHMAVKQQSYFFLV